MKLVRKLLEEARALPVDTPEDARVQHDLIQKARRWAVGHEQMFLIRLADRVQAETAIRRLQVFREARARKEENNT